MIAARERRFIRAVTRCLKCGAPLPAHGECTRCASGSEKTPASAPALDKPLNLDRARIPSFGELSAAFRPPAVAPLSPPAPAKVEQQRTAPAPAVAASPAPPLPDPLPPPAPRNAVAAAPNAVAEAPGELFSAARPAPVAAPPPEPDRAEESEERQGAEASAAAAPDAAAGPVQPGGVTGTVRIHAAPAASWRRILAWLVDGTMVVAVFALYLFVAARIAGLSFPASAGGLDGFVSMLHRLEPVIIPGLAGLLFLAALYGSLCGFLGGRTLGGLLLGIRLVDSRGQPPSPTRSVIRALLGCVSFALALCGFWSAPFDRRRQTLHDKLTRTFVVRPVKG